MKGFVPCAAILAVGAAAMAQSPTDPATPAREQVRRVVVYGAEPCPPSTSDEIIVCARRPETERYRIPEELRDEATEEDPASEAWASRAQSLEYVGETGIQSCSTVGPGGVSGCWAEMMRMAREERRQAAEGQPQP
ncbi:hypothetical protein ACFQRC_06675 [Enterovirga sp. GCM10030262]|uniref:hypothetical protein n=1 Tax=Enterovirga sp. GCM10030262 TaxID=3273391 RepID=UPI00361E9CB9